MEVRRGDAFVVPSLVKHGYIDAGGLDVCHILLHPDYITENLNRFRWLDGYLAFFTMEPYFRRHGKFRHGLKLEESDCANAISLFQKIEQEGQVRKSGSNWMQECLVSQLIIMLCRIHAAAFIQQLEPSGTHVHLRAVLNAITLAAKKKTVDVSLNEMAHAAGLERSYFCRVFKKITGMTPREFVRYEVTREARRLLFESSLNISEIALKLGYCDSAHFCSSFRTITGYNPSELRRRYFDFESVRKI
jgi:AraC-like DNA-binding protein